MTGTKTRGVLVFSIIVFTVVAALAFPFADVHAAPTTITAYESQYPVIIVNAYQPSQWRDTPTLNETTSGMTFAAKQNGTGWFFLMIWNQSSYCSDLYCFGGIELGHLNNSQPMGSHSTPTIMILASRSFNGKVDEFVSTGEATPTSVEQDGYKTQSTCGLSFTNNQYVVQCYRPFKLTNASPYDFPTLGTGSIIEIGFAVGEFSAPGKHLATDMSIYQLTFSNQTYGGTSTGSSSTSASTTSTTSSPPTTATPSVLDYSAELATIVAGFLVIVFIAMW
jgi:hypothetical protein